MTTITTADGHGIYHPDWEEGRPGVLSHGITDTHKDQLGKDLLAFLESVPS